MFLNPTTEICARLRTLVVNKMANRVYRRLILSLINILYNQVGIRQLIRRKDRPQICNLPNLSVEA